MVGPTVSGLFNRGQAKKNRKFQRQMSNTAYRRSVRDLKKAGLNPMLAYGGSASTPPGAQAQMPVGDVAGAGTKAFSAKSESSLRTKQQSLIDAQIDATIAQGDHSAAGAGKARAEQRILDEKLNKETIIGNWWRNLLGPSKDSTNVIRNLYEQKANELKNKGGAKKSHPVKITPGARRKDGSYDEEQEEIDEAFRMQEFRRRNKR